MKSAPNGLRQARMNLGLSQKELAERVGTNDVTVNRWENGVTSPSPFFQKQLYKIFGKTAAELGLHAKSHYARVVSLPKLHNPLFTGRDELLAQLHERLATSRTAALTQAQALFGLGGVGKTQTAFEYAYTYKKEYTSVFWIRAATREMLVADYVALAEQLGLSKKDGQDQSRMVAAVKEWLEIHPNWLLILDNVDDLSLAQEFVPDEHDGYVLLTTRAQALGTFAESIEVDQLSVQDGTFFLLRRSQLLKSGESLENLSSEIREAAQRIVREMDGLPLALVQVGAYIEETGCSLTDYLGIYATHRKEHLARRSELSHPKDYPDTVDTTWSISFQQVEQLSPTAADILNLCAFLAPDAIPEELFTRGAAALDTLPVAAVAD
ncbi:MAG TPA: XRE family transcriptional regulator, partial [Ktedonobacter sp.]|nr:XRE family transcriptional regulator [Ktedonobacter sp.]